MLKQEPEQQPDNRRQQSKQANASKAGHLEFRNVSLSYDSQHQALDDVSFRVHPGQFTAIVGHSGSGKSSIINLLMRFYQHQQGDILIDGHPLAALDEQTLRQSMGLVFQEPFVFTGTLEENITLDNKAITRDHAIAAVDKVQASSFINRLAGGLTMYPASVVNHSLPVNGNCSLSPELSPKSTLPAAGRGHSQYRRRDRAVY